MAMVDALLAPKAFKVKDKEPEQLLIDYDAYMKTVKNFSLLQQPRMGQQIAPSWRSYRPSGGQTWWR